MKSPEFYGWAEKRSPDHQIQKAFQFNSKTKLNEFLVGLLQVQHEPGDPLLQATEKRFDYTIVVSVELGSYQTTDYLVKEIVSQVETLFNKIA